MLLQLKSGKYLLRIFVYSVSSAHQRLLLLISGIGYEDLKVPFGLGVALVIALCFIFFVYVTENKIIHI